MSYEVTLQPSGHRFRCEAHQSVLEAALGSGINLSYHCESGSCGECRARILEGEVEPHRHYDFVIPEAEKIRNTVLLCSVTPQTDLVIEATEATGAIDIPFQQVTAKITRIEQPSRNNMVLHLRTPRTQTLRFLAGQYIQATIPGIEPVYNYIASCPCNGMILQLHVGRSPHPFSQHVFENLKTGDLVELAGPSGDFTLDEYSSRDMVMVVQDTGFAPIKSLIEHAISLDQSQSITLFWLVQPGQYHYQDNYCRAWEDALDRFRYEPLQLQADSAGNTDYKNAVEKVLQFQPMDTPLDWYLVGPQRMLDKFSQACACIGEQPARIHAAHSLDLAEAW